MLWLLDRQTTVRSKTRFCCGVNEWLKVTQVSQLTTFPSLGEMERLFLPFFTGKGKSLENLVNFTATCLVTLHCGNTNAVKTLRSTNQIFPTTLRPQPVAGGLPC